MMCPNSSDGTHQWSTHPHTDASGYTRVVVYCVRCGTEQ